MQTVTFTLRTITPLFLAGADQTTAELRAPSFRGLMRYWQRALVGGIVGTDNAGFQQVKEAENELFGTTDKGSSIAVRVSAPSSQAKEFTEETATRVGNTWQSTGKGYLLWSMAQSGKLEKGNFKPARWYFPPNTSFQIRLSSFNENNIKLNQAAATLWLLTHLGGVGSRSHRAAGSLVAQINEGDSKIKLPFQVPENAQALQEQLKQGIHLAKTLYADYKQRPIQQASFDVLARNACRIWVLQEKQPWTSAEIAMQRLGEKLQDYRSRIKLIVRRKIFGLPLMPIIRDQRRASPLLLRIAELQQHRYVVVAVLFKTVSNGVFVKDYDLIEEWIDEFDTHLEVML